MATNGGKTENDKKSTPNVPDLIDSSVPATSAFGMDKADAIIAMGEKAQRVVDAVIKMRAAAMRLTNINDWVDEGGKPYLTSGGAQKLRSAFGISYRFIDGPTKIALGAEGHYRYQTTMEFLMGSITTEAVGSRASNDAFFTRYYEFQNGTRLEKSRTPIQVDEGDVMKSSITNCIERGVTEILALKNTTWEELEGANIRRGQLAGVKFKDKKGAAKSPEEKPPAQDKGAEIPPSPTPPMREPGDEEPEPAPLRKEIPQDQTPATENQKKAVYAVLKKAGQDLTIVTNQMFGEIIPKDNLLTFIEASAIIKKYGQ